MKRTGFTLVEILIVVIILGILAAIVIPQFTEASNDARNSALVSDLQTLRSQVELYKVQHNEKLPCVDAAGAPLDAAGTIVQLTTTTDNTGAAVAPGTVGALGPYLQKFPTNGFVPGAVGNTLVLVTANPATGDDSTGWWFNTATGQCGPNDSKANGTTLHVSQ